MMQLNVTNVFGPRCAIYKQQEEYNETVRF